MPMLNYTTRIDASKTVGEMQKMLAEYGAMRIGVDYEGGSPSALSFALMVDGDARIFNLPANVDKMQNLLIEKSRKRELKSLSATVATSRDHAERVAWRILKDWLAAQLALIESTMVDLEQVMLPYMRVTSDGRSFYEVIRDQGLEGVRLLQLEAAR